MDIFLGVIVGILVLTVVVTIHEFGHFIIAKRNGVKVLEFGIGFPPKAKTWLHIPVKQAEKYCKKFKYDDIKAEKIRKRANHRLNSKKSNKKKWIWIPLPKDEWYEETDEGIVPKKQDYLIFSLNWLPIGGFCQMDGETNIDTRKGTFGAANFWSKTKILFAGVAMNWLLAFIVFTILAWTGIPELFDGQYRVNDDTYYIESSSIEIKEIFENTPADKSGLQVGDKIYAAINPDGEITQINNAKDLQNFNSENQGKTVKYQVHTEKSPKLKTCDDSSDPFECNKTAYTDCVEESCWERDTEYEVTLNNDTEKYILGVSMGQFGMNKYRATWSAPIVGAVTTFQLTGETYRGIGSLIGNVFSGIIKQFSGDEATREEGKAAIETAGDSVSGPVGIVGVLFPAVTKTGLDYVLYLMALISVSLACMNVLPIPALDGGRWFLIALYRALKRPLSPETENKIVSRAFAVLLILAALITVLDVIKIVR